MDKPAGAGRGRGIALTECYGAVMAAVVEVTARDQGRLSIDNVWAAVDCGPVVHPAIAEGQIEGAHRVRPVGCVDGEVTFNDGAAVQSNWDDYRVPALGHDAPCHHQFLDTCIRSAAWEKSASFPWRPRSPTRSPVATGGACARCRFHATASRSDRSSERAYARFRAFAGVGAGGLEIRRQILPRVAPGHARDLLGRAFGDDLAAAVAALGTPCR
jgi:hypothetical protein